MMKLRKRRQGSARPGTKERLNLYDVQTDHTDVHGEARKEPMVNPYGVWIAQTEVREDQSSNPYGVRIVRTNVAEVEVSKGQRNTPYSVRWQ